MSDLISRQELMNRLEEFCKWCKDGRLQGVEFVLDCLVPNTPSADRPTGKWIGEYEAQSICSECGKNEDEFIHGFGEWETMRGPKYCPNFGAKMKGATK